MHVGLSAIVRVQVCALALEGAGWDADAALQLLQEFRADAATELVVLQQVGAVIAASISVHVCWEAVERGKQRATVTAPLPDLQGENWPLSSFSCGI